MAKHFEGEILIKQSVHNHTELDSLFRFQWQVFFFLRTPTVPSKQTLKPFFFVDSSIKPVNHG
jgi:hypothetical protein